MSPFLRRLGRGARRMLGQLSPPLFDPPIRALLCTTYPRREEVALGLTLSGMLVRLCLDAAEGLRWLEALEQQPEESPYGLWRAELVRVGATPGGLHAVDAWLAQRQSGAATTWPGLGALILDEHAAPAHARERFPGLMAYADERQVPLVFYPRHAPRSFVEWGLPPVVPANVLSWPPRADRICQTVELIRREELTSPEVSFERYFRRFSPE